MATALIVPNLDKGILEIRQYVEEPGQGLKGFIGSCREKLVVVRRV
jgi:hypothetical protein